MIDQVGKERPVEKERPHESIRPMNINEAIEMMFIIGPHAREIIVMSKEKTAGEIMSALLKWMREDSPINYLRVWSLMMHKDIEECASDLKEKSAEELFRGITELLVINPLMDLAAAAIILGLDNRGA